MLPRGTGENPIESFFREALDESLHGRMGIETAEEVDAYLASMLARFLKVDAIYAVRDAAGHRVETVAEMLMEGDIRLNADSFDREREVHRHIGDFLLFWSGLFPEFLKHLKAPGSKDMMLNVQEQGRVSYGIVGSFDHPPYDTEAQTFRILSDRFADYQRGLTLVRASFEGFARQGWVDGFSA